MSPVLLAAVAGLALVGVPLAFAVRGARAGRRGGLRDRAAAVEGAVGALVAVVAAHRLVPWQAVPPVLWALPVAATVLGVATSALAWPALPALAGTSRRRRLVGAGTEVAGGLALLALVLLG